MAVQGDENIIAAVDIGTTKICTVIAEAKGGEINVIGVGNQETTGGVVKGGVVDIASTADAIKKSVAKAEEMAGMKVQAVITSISGKSILGISGKGMTSLSHSKHKEITEEDRLRAIEGAKSISISHDREMIHVLPVQYIVDSQDEIKNPLGMTGMKLEVDVYIITAATTAIDNIKKVIDRAGYTMEDIILQPIASAHSVLYQDEKDIGVLVLDIGGGTTDMALYVKDALKFVRVIPIGGQYITGDVAMGLHIPKSAAEEIKKKSGIIYPEDAAEDEFVDVPDMGGEKVERIPRRDLAQFIHPRVHELVRFVQAELQKEGVDKSMYAGGIVITGGSSMLRGMDRMIKEQMDTRVRLGVPLREKVVGLYDIVSKPEYATVIGLIDYYVNQQGINNRMISHKGLLEKALFWIKNLISEYI
jgi:cell division protein FtsA